MPGFYFNPSAARQYTSYLLLKVFTTENFTKLLQKTLKELKVEKNQEIAEKLADVIINDILLIEQGKLDLLEAEGIARRLTHEIEVAYPY